MTIIFRRTAAEIEAEQLAGFFVGWRTRPTPETHLRLLHASDRVVVAIDGETSQVVGFATALTDGILSSYISFVEVLPTYQRQGVGRELVRQLLEALGGLYMVDAMTDADLEPFYRALGMLPGKGMMLRRYESQAGLS
jgi:ribosomal protein S18 acetylase RimI-like enzyme